MDPTLHKDIIILGAGIGGFTTFETLAKELQRNHSSKRITVIDRNNYFTFTPLLHEVATGSVEPGHCAASVRELMNGTPHTFLQASVQTVDPANNLVITDQGTFTYEMCVVALGSTNTFFKTPGANTHAYSVRTLSEAARIQDTLIKQLEREPDHLSMTVVGGGYTGVEMAGQLAYFKKRTLSSLYPKTTMRIRLVDPSSTVVQQLPLKAQDRIIQRLNKLGVELMLNKRVQEVGESTITFASGERYTSDITIWCAGVGNVATSYLPEKDCANGKMPVNHYLQHITYPNLYGVGDIIQGTNENDSTPYPPLGEAANQEGRYVGRHIAASLQKKSIKPFFFASRGTLMPIGDRYGIAIIGSFVFSGWFAWWLRRTVYLKVMPGFLRKLKITIDWTLHLFAFGNITRIGKSSDK